jgi:hypothetical protein
MNASQTRSEDFDRIVEDLYAGTLDDTAWDRAILGVADMVSASGALLFAVNPTNREILRDENHRFDPGVLDNYRRYWVYHDCRLPYFMPAPVGRPVTEQLMPLSGATPQSLMSFYCRLTCPTSCRCGCTNRPRSA